MLSRGKQGQSRGWRGGAIAGKGKSRSLAACSPGWGLIGFRLLWEGKHRLEGVRDGVLSLEAGWVSRSKGPFSIGESHFKSHVAWLCAKNGGQGLKGGGEREEGEGTSR